MKTIYIHIAFQHLSATSHKDYTIEVCDSTYSWLGKNTYLDDMVNFSCIENEYYTHENHIEDIAKLRDGLNKLSEDCAKEFGYSAFGNGFGLTVSLKHPHRADIYGPKMLAKKMEDVKKGDKDAILEMLDYYAGAVYDMEKAKSMVLQYADIDLSLGLSVGSYEVYKTLSRYTLHVKQLDEETRTLIAGLFTQILTMQDTIDPEVVSEYLDLYSTLNDDDNDLRKLLVSRANDKDRVAMEVLGLISDETFFYEEEYKERYGGKIPAAVYLAEIFNRCFDDGEILQYMKNFFHYGIGVQRDERILQYIKYCIDLKKYTDEEIEKRQQLFQNIQFGEAIEECEYNLEDIDIDNIYSYEEEDFVKSLGSLCYYNTYNGDNNSLLLLFKADTKEMSYFMDVVQTWRDNDELNHLWDIVMYRLCMEIVEEKIDVEYSNPVLSIVENDDYLNNMYLELANNEEEERPF